MESGAVNDLYDKYKGESFELLFVISDTTQGPPDAAYCSLLKDQYNLEMPVVFDTNETVRKQLKVELNAGVMVGTKGMVITLKEHAGIKTIDWELKKIFNR